MQKKLLLLVFVLFYGTLIAEVSTLSPEQQQLLEQLPPDQRQSVEDKIRSANSMDSEIEEIFEEENTLTERPKPREEENDCTDCVYGYSLFKYAPTTFAPSNNTPISASYKLGPGDKVKLNYYGTEQASTEAFISRDGTLELPMLGPINLAGLSIEDSKEIIRADIL